MASTPVLGSRKALLSYLTVACEIEQGLCLQYLFTAFSLKDDFSEGGISTLEQLTAVRRWKADLFLIAAQEMLHLTQAANLSTAAGGTVQLGRPNFPQGKDYYPTQLPWQLAAFSSETIARYVCYERPSDEALARMHWASFDGTPILAIYEDIRSEAAPGPFADLPAQRPARARDAATVGEIYEAIAEAFQVLPDVIIGPEEAQIDGRKVDFTQVVKVLSRDDARAAVELIIHQGEGTKSERQDSHFGVFLHIYNQFVDFQKADPSFQPVRPVCTNPLSKLHVDNTFPGWRLIDNKSTRAVNDLCSSVYETMLLMLYRFFATPAHEEAAQRKLSAAFLRVMTTVIKPL
ncbi:MAG: hypothetical protein JWO56_3278, partial [Acidobacteria bacterium]|nr:hypothetical protein [Acidobacteriota bacterium]